MTSVARVRETGEVRGVMKAIVDEECSASSIFPERRHLFFPFLSLREGIVVAVRWECGKRDSVFQGLWEAVVAFHQAVISTAPVRWLRSFFFGLFGLFNTITGDVEFKNDAVVNQPVDGSCCGHWIFEDAVPL